MSEIAKRYWVNCEHCLETNDLWGQSIKQCEEELKDSNWKKLKGKWYCDKCLAEHKKEDLQGYREGE